MMIGLLLCRLFSFFFPFFSVFKSIRFLKRWSENWEIKISFYLIIFFCGNNNFLQLWVTLATNDTVLYFLSNYIYYLTTESNYTHLHGGKSWYTNLYSPASILSASTKSIGLKCNVDETELYDYDIWKGHIRNTDFRRDFCYNAPLVNWTAKTLPLGAMAFH